jgi:hypothetical protein
MRRSPKEYRYFKARDTRGSRATFGWIAETVKGLGGVGGDFSWEGWLACRRGASGGADVGGVERS